MSKQTEVKTSAFPAPPEAGSGLGFPKRSASAGLQQALRSLAVPAGSHWQPEPTGLRVPVPGAAPAATAPVGELSAPCRAAPRWQGNIPSPKIIITVSIVGGDTEIVSPRGFNKALVGRQELCCSLVLFFNRQPSDTAQPSDTVQL